MAITSGMVQMHAAPGFSSYVASKIAVLKVFDQLVNENPDLTTIHSHFGVTGASMLTKILSVGFQLPYFSSSFAVCRLCRWGC
ncbi:uncharacterized protein BCR38DRAFT_449656 [Pseudomassariella vexata]|uniref:Uncharacterized protein n=1 Tax=Pseudomassariella vexata TaxID=1141098 RepID=A0A1Y2DEN9_9PEZI|nr:uncharacterized protein BCR38DRAFT_449656 [Pseudomassariella vexata]ORY57596.1 hypothetical protein BCR38DRAFT_449656 [Pseudomassariella vexata]